MKGGEKMNRAKICKTARKLMRKGYSRSEAFTIAWAKAKQPPIKYKCFFCGGHHEIDGKSVAIIGMVNLALIGLLILKLFV